MPFPNIFCCSNTQLKEPKSLNCKLKLNGKTLQRHWKRFPKHSSMGACDDAIKRRITLFRNSVTISNIWKNI